MKMQDKSLIYFENEDTKEITTSKELKRNWIKNGYNVNFYRWSNFYGEFIYFITEEA